MGANQNSRLDVLHSLFVHGSLQIDAYHTNTIDKSTTNGHYYSDKAPGIVLLAIPSFSASVVILRVLHVSLDAPNGWLASSWIATIGSVGLLTALGGLATLVFLTRLVGQRFAFIACLAVFLGAAPFPYATMLFSHAAVLSLICIAMWAMADEEFWKRIAPGLPPLSGSSRREEAQTTSANQSEPPHDGCYDFWMKRYLLAGLCCGLAISSEYTAATAAGGVLALAFLTGFRRGVLLALGAIPALLLIPLWNWACFGNPMAFGYHHLAEAQFQEMNHGFFGIGPPSAYGAWVILLSPERGLFFWTPFFMMAFLGVKPLLARAPRLLWVSGIVIVVHVVCISGYYMPNGGRALGPRLLAAMLPFLAIVAACGLRGYPRTGIVLGCCSILLTGVGTLIDAMPPRSSQNPLFNYDLPRLMAGKLTHNLGSCLGAPAFVSAGLLLVVMLGGYLCAVIRTDWPPATEPMLGGR